MGSRRPTYEDRETRGVRDRSRPTPSRAHQDGSSSHRVLELQESAGNAAVIRMLGAAQLKLVVGSASDGYEREADRVAHQVIQTLRTGVTEPADDEVTAASAGIARSVAVVGAEGGTADPDVESQIGAAHGGGRRLDGSTLTRMESAFSADFGAVRVHTGPSVDGLNSSLQSRAFTLGSDIFVRGSDFKPGTSGGDELLAHELTHTIQQGGAKVRRKTATPRRYWTDVGDLVPPARP